MSRPDSDPEPKVAEETATEEDVDIPEKVVREASDRVARLERDMAALREELASLANELAEKARAAG